MRWGYSSEFEECLRQNHESGDATASGLLAGQLLIKAGWHRMRSHEEGARADEVEALALLGRMVEVGLDECLDDFQFLKAALSADVVADAELLMCVDESKGLCRPRKDEPEVEGARLLVKGQALQ